MGTKASKTQHQNHVLRTRKQPVSPNSLLRNPLSKALNKILTAWCQAPQKGAFLPATGNPLFPSPAGFPANTCQKSVPCPPALRRTPWRNDGITSARGGLWALSILGLQPDKGAALKLKTLGRRLRGRLPGQFLFCNRSRLRTSFVKCLLGDQHFTFGKNAGEHPGPGPRGKIRAPSVRAQNGPDARLCHSRGQASG